MNELMRRVWFGLSRASRGLAVAVWAGLAGSALAGPVTVTSGEHDGFTRIALDFGHPVDWEMGRTTDGYALRIKGEEPEYDLAAVFRLIGRDRIAALWQDKDSGDLNLGVGCACHAMPFAFRPSIVVIDIKEGDPPKGSAFEEILDPGQTATPRPPAPRPLDLTAGAEGQGYDWVGARIAGAVGATTETQAVPVTPLPVGAGLEPLRKALLEEMSRGAAAGLIDMSLPRDPTEGMVVGLPMVHVNKGDKANYETRLGEGPDGPQSAHGAECLPDEALDVVNWSLSDKPVAEQMAETMTGLVGEFDKPDPEGVKRAVKFDLYLGFGAEARALLRAFPLVDPEAKAWTSMGYLIDGEPDTEAAFRDQAGCDTPAAMWAALSIEDLAHEPLVDTKAIVRAFSALPPHLRLLLGPRLADKMLSIQEELAARSIRDAVTRLPGEKAADVTLLEAKMDVAEGDLTAAQARLTPLASDSGPASEEALADLVSATAEDLKPVPPEQVDALAALAQERRGGPDSERFEAAVTLGRAAAGQFDLAFERVAEQPELAPQVWSLLSVLGTDDDLVAHAIFRPGKLPPPDATGAAAKVTERLLGLGFVDQAVDWLSLAPEPDAKLVARVALAQRDGAAAIEATAGIEDPEAAALKAEGLQLSGNHRAAADVYQAIGQEDAYWRAEGLAQDWPVLAEKGPKPWSDAAQSLLSDPTEAAPVAGEAPPGPLATARAIVGSSEQTRGAIDALLTSVPMPELATQ